MLIFTECGLYKIGYYGKNCGWEFDMPMRTVTHWQPLPQPPKEDK